MSAKRLPVLALLLAAAILHAGEAFVPGDVNSLCYYGNFFYNLPEGDFFYYLNDALLFSEPPDDTLYENGMRDRLGRLVQRHRQVKEFILGHGQAQNLTISYDLRDEKALPQAREFLALLGLELGRDAGGEMTVKAASEPTPIRYGEFIGLKPGTLQEQLRRSHVFFFKLRETAVRLPWDPAWLAEITGQKLDRDSFFAGMIANKKLSLLLAVLFRLSDEEVALINGGPLPTSGPAWKRLYLDKKMLMGMLTLSTALRVRDGKLQLPGGEKAGRFWAALAGSDPQQAPLDFIGRLCTLDNGKLNYLFVFSSFLNDEARRALFFDYDADKVGRLYRRIVLGANERTQASAFPRLENFTYYTLLFALKTGDGRIRLPLGGDAWAKAMGLDLPAGSDECGFLEALLAASGGPSRKATLLRKFISLYCRFGDRQLLLSPEFLQKAFAGFDSRSVLLDYVERVPLNDPASFDLLADWQDAIQGLGREERRLYTAIGQSLLEAIAQAARFSPAGVDYDALVRQLAAIPLKRPDFYDGLFALLARLSGADSPRSLADDALAGFVLRGLKNAEVAIRGETYTWRVRDLAAAQIREMMSSQEVCSLGELARINRDLQDLAEEPAAAASLGRRLREACENLPYPDFSGDAPRSLRERVIAYEREGLIRDLDSLLKKAETRAARQDVAAAVAAFKGRYLLPLAKDHLLALAYALNARHPDLHAFINPNLARLHDFSDDDASPWETGCVPGKKTDFSGYYLRGGLSRLNLAFAVSWSAQLFQKNIFNSEQTQALVTNVMAALPQPPTVHGGALDALLVELAVEMLAKSRENDELRRAIEEAALSVVAGYHHRRLSGYLDGSARDYHLFASELRELGARLAEREELCGSFSQRDELARYRRPPLSTLVALESDGWGGVMFNSFGTLAARACPTIPQEAAQLFGSGWLSGETLNEFKVKAACLAQGSGLPLCLAGQFVLEFLRSVGRAVYAQNTAKDYHSTLFVIDIMNSGHLRKTLTQLQTGGYLRLK